MFRFGCRTAIESNEQHDGEVASARNVAEEDVMRNSKDIQNHFESEFQFIFLIISWCSFCCYKE